jgi:Protein of unknown function (DUF998)
MTEPLTKVIAFPATAVSHADCRLVSATAREQETGPRQCFPAAANVAVVALFRARAARFRARAAAGIVGPVVFTGAWLASSLLQTGHSPAKIQISGLAAPDAKEPWIMIAGFLVLGGCTVAFGSALQEALAPTRRRVAAGTPVDAKSHVSAETPAARAGPGLAPRLIQSAGVLTIAAGLLRRDHMLLVPGAVSWHNHAHDLVSAVLYVDLVLAQVLLARRFGREPAWRSWQPWLLASAAVTAAVLIAFAAGTSAADAGILQRVAVTIPLAAIAAIAARLLKTPMTAG